MAQIYALAQGAENEDEGFPRKIWPLALGSLGVAYGDIGTSPLYALREAVQHAKNGGLSLPEAVIGVLSLILWSLILIVTVKYVTVLLRADNKGEGGTFALMALGQSVAKRAAPLISLLGRGRLLLLRRCGADAGNLGTVGGGRSQARGRRRWSRGSSRSPSSSSSRCSRCRRGDGTRGLVLWANHAFVVLGACRRRPDPPGGRSTRFRGIQPVLGVAFLARHGLLSLTVLGLVFLAVTGAEALYADLGHFGRKPIQIAWGVWCCRR